MSPSQTFSAAPTSGAALIKWYTHIPADSTVEYGLTASYGQQVTDAWYGQLPLHEAPVQPVPIEQLLVASGLHHAPVIEDHHPIGVADRRQPVGDHDGRAACAKPTKRRKDDFL